MFKPRFILCLVFTMFLTLTFLKHNEHSRTILPSLENTFANSFFELDEPVNILILAIDLQTELGFAPVVNGRLESSRLKKGPVLISPEARAGLQKIGLPGVSLILGHRQWGFKPLVFARLNELANSDRIIIFNNRQVITYLVYEKHEINPGEVWGTIDEVSAESLKENRSVLILVTCAPYGYNRHRLLIFANRKVEASARFGSDVKSRGIVTRP